MSRSIITPHPSHTWGSVAGERRCVICHTAPDWPISEAECDITATTPAERAALAGGRKAGVRGPAMRSASIALACSLRDDGMQWAAIAERVGGYSMRAVQQAVLRYERRGRFDYVAKGRPVTHRELPTRNLQPGDMDVARARQAAGESIADIAESLGVPYDALRYRLRSQKH